MKLLNHSIKARILWLLASFIAIVIASPLPGLHAQKSREETQNKTTWMSDEMSYPDYLEYQKQSTSFTGLAAEDMLSAAIDAESQSDVIGGSAAGVLPAGTKSDEGQSAYCA